MVNRMDDHGLLYCESCILKYKKNRLLAGFEQCGLQGFGGFGCLGLHGNNL